MLEDYQIEQLLVELKLSDAARQLVREVRSRSPVREPGNHLGNVNVWHFSKKMGNKHLRLESRTVEAAAAVLYEFDSELLEYWPQPMQVGNPPIFEAA